MNHTRRALISSIFLLILCCSLLVGTTFAWFTDSVTSSRNTIRSGNLDLVLEYWDSEQKKYIEVDSQTVLFNDAALWEPGYTEVVYLQIRNAGTLALEYQLSVNVLEEIMGKTADGSEIKLSDYLTFKVIESETDLADTFTRDSARNANVDALQLQTYIAPEAALEKNGDAAFLALVIYMPEQIGNEANSNGVDVPSIKLGVQLFATQLAFEEDSFDETYDDIDMASSYTALKAYKNEDGNYILTDDFSTDNPIMMGKGVQATIDFNGKTITAENKNTYAFAAQYGSVLHLTGEGNIYMGRGFFSNKDYASIAIDSGTFYADTAGKIDGIPFHSLAQNDSKMVVNGGTFISSVDNACLFYSTTNSTITINGGFFENTADDTPDLLGVGDNKYNANRIILKGGTFVNYNPKEDNMFYTGTGSYDDLTGPWIVIWEGYTVVAETQASGDIWYSVVPA